MAGTVTVSQTESDPLALFRASLVQHVSTCELIRFSDIADVSDCHDEVDRAFRVDEACWRLWDALCRNRLRPVSFPTEREIAPGFVMIELFAIEEWSAPCSLTTVN